MIAAELELVVVAGEAGVLKNRLNDVGHRHIDEDAAVVGERQRPYLRDHHHFVKGVISPRVPQRDASDHAVELRVRAFFVIDGETDAHAAGSGQVEFLAPAHLNAGREAKQLADGFATAEAEHAGFGGEGIGLDGERVGHDRFSVVGCVAHRRRRQKARAGPAEAGMVAGFRRGSDGLRCVVGR